MIDGTPPDVLAAAAKLACSELVIVNLGFNKPDIIDATWTYFYDRDFFLTRLSTPHLQSRNNVPPGCCSVQAECYFSDKYGHSTAGPRTAFRLSSKILKRCGLISSEDEIIFRNVMHIKYANVIFDLESVGAAGVVHEYLRDLGIQYCGRYGEWAYIWTDQAFISGENAATRVIDLLGGKQKDGPSPCCSQRRRRDRLARSFTSRRETGCLDDVNRPFWRSPLMVLRKSPIPSALPGGLGCRRQAYLP